MKEIVPHKHCKRFKRKKTQVTPLPPFLLGGDNF